MVARFRPDPLCELTALPRTPWLDFVAGMGRKGREEKGRERRRKEGREGMEGKDRGKTTGETGPQKVF